MSHGFTHVLIRQEGKPLGIHLNHLPRATQKAIQEKIKHQDSGTKSEEKTTRLRLRTKRSWRTHGPQKKITDILKNFFSDDDLKEEYRPFTERRFRCDLALPALRLSIEIEGFEYHGRHKHAFRSDRERSNYFVAHGWHQIRLTTGMIFQDTDACVQMILQTAQRMGWTADHANERCSS